MRSKTEFSRRRFLWAGAAAASSAGLAKAQSNRPNIIVVMTDDQGYGDIGRLGNTVIKTPNLDRLHDVSIRLTNFHVSPTCAPTRASLMTGRHEFKSGVTHTIFERERLSLKATTVAQALKAAGYATGIFGKWHLGDAEPYQPGNRGFEEVFIHGCGGIGQDYPGTCSDAPGNTYFDPTILHNGKFERTNGYCTDVFFGAALKWIDGQRSSGRPFFAYITPNAPHVPLQCPEEYQKMYSGQGLPPETEKYFGMVTNIDDNIGKLRAQLEATGLTRNTILIFLTDNGGTGGVKIFNAGMRGAKATPYEGGVRVPAFFHWEGHWKPRDEGALTAHIDLFPTLAEIAGASLPSGVKLDGRSLMPLLNGQGADWPDRMLFTHVGRWPKGEAAQSKYWRCAVRSTRYHMVNPTKENHWELYDMQADPGEKRNIAAEHPEVVREMDAAYDKWWAEVLPLLDNEDAVPPRIAPYKTRYWSQYGGGPGVLN